MLILFNILKLFALNIIFVYNPTIQHYIPPISHCLAAVTCNHTGEPLCGIEKDEKDIRMFLDKCHMLEYNCGNHKAYSGADLEKCSNNATEKTETIMTQDIQNQPTVANNVTLTETTLTTLNPNNTLDSKPESTKSKLNSTKATLSNSTFKSCTCTVPYNGPLTENDNKSTFNSTIIEENVTTPLTKITDKYINPHFELNNNTVPSGTEYPTSNISCDIYPKKCDRPHTWETTLKGETRDFFQILKARFGNNVKILEDTTHWPNRRTVHINDEDGFQFGRHNENGRL